ncbi:hypothetical protein HPB51_006079 [Rhipicephalus microplus]|uniref:CCHC-type domain-containing protein n=1 Tax=Rhipicephalus microplus TaxID=6941 RepID=A0A9J6EFP3_RHIMP|nr:hypothetical protein HPB51_006079 [Rhipicephalus microplus]
MDDLPHQIGNAGELALVVAPGRPMQCLRCNVTGHVRRECKVPRCSHCRRFGHVDAQCVCFYASVAGSVDTVDVAQHIMDVTEAEDAAQGSGDGSVAALYCYTSVSTGDAPPEPTDRSIDSAAALAKASEDGRMDLSGQVSGASELASRQGQTAKGVSLRVGADLNSEEGSQNTVGASGSNTVGTSLKRSLEGASS